MPIIFMSGAPPVTAVPRAARVRLEDEKAAVEEELRAANERLGHLLEEVNHRVANSLQLVSTFIHMQSRGLEKAAREALSDTQRRTLGSRLVLAMAKSLASDFNYDPSHRGVCALVIAAI